MRGHSQTSPWNAMKDSLYPNDSSSLSRGMFQQHPVKISLVFIEDSWRDRGHKVAILCKSALLENWCESQYSQMPLFCLSDAFSLGNSWNFCFILRLYTLTHVFSAPYFPCSHWPTDWCDMRSDTVIHCYVLLYNCEFQTENYPPSRNIPTEIFRK